MESLEDIPALRELADSFDLQIDVAADAIMQKHLDIYICGVGRDEDAANEEILYAEVFLKDLRAKRECLLHRISDANTSECLASRVASETS